MTDEAAVTRAANWLRVTAKQDEDVKLALFAAYRRHEVTNISELARDHPNEVLALCEALQDMLEGVADMDRYDAEVRELWRSG